MAGACCRRLLKHSIEIHFDFVTKGQKYTPFESLDNEAVVRNSITFKSTSKSVNLAATKCAYMFSQNADYMQRIKDTGHHQTVNTLGIIASEVAYNEGEDWLDQVVDYIDGNMNFAVDYIKKNVPHVKFDKPEGTYLASLDVNSLRDKIDAEKLAADANKKRESSMPQLQAEHMIEQFLVDNAGVQVNEGYRYGSGRMRMNLATSRKLLEKALRRIGNATRQA